MTVQHLAGGSAGGSFTGLVGVELAELELRLPSLQAELAAAADLAANLQANLEIDPTISIQAALAFAADATAALALAGPSLKANLSLGLDAQLALIAKLSADLGDLNLKIGLLKAKIAALAGVHVYLYMGPPDQLGPEISARLAADVSADLVVAPVIVATTAASAEIVTSVIGL